MVKLWKQWCRLCAREDNNNNFINVFHKDEIVSPLSDVIKKYFSVNINHHDDWPRVICLRCLQLVNTIITFTQRTTKVQAMFLELYSSVEDLNAGQLKLQYELHEDNVESHIQLCTYSSVGQIFETKSNVTEEMNEPMVDLKELGYVNEETLDLADIKTDNVKEENNNFVEYEWTNQQKVKLQEAKTGKEKLKQKKKRMARKLETFTCVDCRKAFPQYFKYRHHMQEIHGVKLVPPKYPCIKCDEVFMTARPLQRHVKIYHPMNQKLTPCSFCGKMFSKCHVAQAHIRAVHLGEKPFVCEECGRNYKTLDSLREHKRTHSDTTSFKCNWCDKQFKSKLGLTIHEDTHSETNYICSKCGLQLNTRRTLNMHMVTHFDQKLYKCDHCGNEYKRAKTLKNHLILHTGLKPYACNFCERTFANGSNCRSHKKKTHPVELAAMEAAGKKSKAANIPMLKQLRTVISNNP